MKFRKLAALFMAAVMIASVPAQTLAEETKTAPLAAEEIDGVSEGETTVDTSDVAEFNSTVSDNGISKLGLHGMTLDAAMLQDKIELKEMVVQLEDGVEGQDYDDSSVYFVCDSESDAEEIADCYGAELENYSYGVGYIDIVDMAEEVQDMSVCEIIALSADMSNSLPALHPNIMHFTNDYSSWGERYQADLAAEMEAGTGAYSVSDPQFDYQWAHRFLGDNAAWDCGIKGQGIKIAIIDTGVRGDHEDFVGRIRDGYNAVDDNGNYDDSDLLETYGNIGGHGTHVAGIAAASVNNGVGGAGIAPEATIIPVRVFRPVFVGKWTVTAYSADLIRGINYATAKNADVINMSLGSSFNDTVEEKAIKKAVNSGVVVVCSAGNDYDDSNNYPAAFPCTISVAALCPAPYDGLGKYAEEFGSYGVNTAYSALSSYSASYGAVLGRYSTTGETVDIAAPGSGYYSTYYLSSSSYTLMNGTSMASPAVAGAAALILQANPAVYATRSAKRNEFVRKIMKDTAYDEKYTSTWQGTSTNGYTVRNHGSIRGGLNVAAAIEESAISVSSLRAPTVESPEAYDSKNLLSGPEKYLIINNTNSVGKIYYTTDGSKPSANNGIKYESGIPLDFSGKLKLKAVVVCNDLVSPVMTYTKSFKARVESIKFGDVTMIAGGKATLMSTIEPSYADWPTMIWPDDMGGYKISGKKGKYTIKAPTPAALTVIEAGYVGSSSVETVQISVDITDVATRGVEFNSNARTTIAVTDEEDKGDEEEYNLNEWVNAYNLPEGSSLYFTSSKSDVISVTPDGYYVAKKPGKATITVTANDGSRKSDKLKVTVVNPITSIDKIKTDTGFEGYGDEEIDVPIAKGGKIKLSTVVNDYERLGKKYKKPTNGKIEWKIGGGGDSFASIDSKGILRVSMDAPAGETFTVRAKAADGFGANQYLQFRVYERSPGIALTYAIVNGTVGNEGVNPVKVTGVGCYNKLMVKYSRSGICKIYENAEESYADPTYAVQLLKKGKTKVTYIIPDGSGVKAVQTVKVKKQ